MKNEAAQGNGTCDEYVWMVEENVERGLKEHTVGFRN